MKKWLKILVTRLINNWIIIVTVIWGLVGISLLSFYTEFKWDVLLGFATWVLAGSVGVAVWQITVNRKSAIQQSEESRKSTNAQIAMEMFYELRSEKTIETLRYIYTLNRDDSPFVSIKDEKRVERLIDKFELLGVLVNQGIVNERLAIEAFAGPPALRCWYQLVHYLRKQEKDRGFYILNYEDFIRRTVEYFKKENTKIIFSKICEKPINLVEEFKKLIDENSEFRPRTLDEIRSEKLCSMKRTNSTSSPSPCTERGLGGEVNPLPSFPT